MASYQRACYPQRVRAPRAMAYIPNSSRSEQLRGTGRTDDQRGDRTPSTRRCRGPNRLFAGLGRMPAGSKGTRGPRGGSAVGLGHGPGSGRSRNRPLDGVRDEEFLLAIAYHSTGHPEFGLLGKFLYLADFLDPGRRFLFSEREELRERLPTDREPVLLAVLRHRITRLLDHESPVLPASLLLWNQLVAS